jgi:hypothetical protein
MWLRTKHVLKFHICEVNLWKCVEICNTLQRITPIYSCTSSDLRPNAFPKTGLSRKVLCRGHYNMGRAGFRSWSSKLRPVFKYFNRNAVSNISQIYSSCPSQLRQDRSGPAPLGRLHMAFCWEGSTSNAESSDRSASRHVGHPSIPQSMYQCRHIV